MNVTCPAFSGLAVTDMKEFKNVYQREETQEPYTNEIRRFNETEFKDYITVDTCHYCYRTREIKFSL